VVVISNHHNNNTTMATTQQQHQPLESPAITALSADIKEKEDALMTERRGGKDGDIINDLKESIAALVANQQALRLALTTQSTQGKSAYSQHVVISLCHYVDVIPKLIVVSLSKCVLSVELALFEGLGVVVLT
jgi:hypothetical protein